MDFAKTEGKFRQELKGQHKKLFVMKPARIDGKWAVDIVEGSIGPLAKVHERIPCANYVSAKKTYNWATKQLGYSY